MAAFGDERLPTRFWEKAAIATSGCWLWIAPLGAHGYGRFWFEGQTRRSHRVAYTRLVRVIPSDLVCDHLCRQRSCCNPSHIELVTVGENVARGEVSAWQVAKTHCPSGHEYVAANVYHFRGARQCKTCRSRRNAERYLA